MDMTQALAKELESRYVVRFQDCDPFGQLNNARYIDYIFNARQDQLARDYGFHIFEHGKDTNQNWVVTRSHIAYLYPALVNESIVIRTKLIQMTESTIVVEAIMFDLELKRPKAVSWTEFTYVSLATGRTVKHPDDLMALFTQVVVEGIWSADGFNQRVDAVRHAYRKRPVEQRTGELQPER